LKESTHRSVANAQRLGADNNALRVHAVEDDLEPLVLVLDTANDRVLGHDIVVKEDLVRVDTVAAHLPDFAHLQPGCLLVDRDDKAGETLGLFLDLVERGCTRQQDHDVSVLRIGDPDLLAFDRPLAVGPLCCHGLHLERVESNVGLRDGKGCTVLAADNAGDVVRALLVRPEDAERLRREHVGVRALSAREPASRLGHHLHHRCSLEHAEARTAKPLRQSNAEPPAIGHGTVEFERVGGRRIPLAPVRVAKACAQLGHRLADLHLRVVEDRRVHQPRWCGR
jgi:hypothetical protein